MGCPSAHYVRGNSPGGTGYIDYWYNRNLSGVKKSDVTTPARTIAMGDGSDGVENNDATYSKTNLPPAWLSDYNKPCWRHLGGANYLFNDGHVSWLLPNQVTTAAGQPKTFSLK